MKGEGKRFGLRCFISDVVYRITHRITSTQVDTFIMCPKIVFLIRLNIIYVNFFKEESNVDFNLADE